MLNRPDNSISQWLIGPNGDLAPFKALISNSADATYRFYSQPDDPADGFGAGSYTPETDRDDPKMVWHVDGANGENDWTDEDFEAFYD